jgi:hypothetical protein
VRVALGASNPYSTTRYGETVHSSLQGSIRIEAGSQEGTRSTRQRLIPTEHGVDSLRQLSGTTFVDATSVDPYVFVAILGGLIAGTVDLLVALLSPRVRQMNLIESYFLFCPAVGENGITSVNVALAVERFESSSNRVEEPHCQACKYDTSLVTAENLTTSRDHWLLCTTGYVGEPGTTIRFACDVPLPQRKIAVSESNKRDTKHDVGSGSVRSNKARENAFALHS